MSDKISPYISEDESISSSSAQKRKAEDDVSQESAESIPKVPKRNTGGMGIHLVSYAYEEDGESEDESNPENGAENAEESYFSNDIGNLPFMKNDGGPVTVLSSEHIEVAYSSPAVLTDGAASVAGSVPEKDNLSSNQASPVKDVAEDNRLDDEVTLPPEPSESCSFELQNVVNRHIQRMRHDISYDPNRMIQDNKSFRNPRFVLLLNFLLV